MRLANLIIAACFAIMAVALPTADAIPSVSDASPFSTDRRHMHLNRPIERSASSPLDDTDILSELSNITPILPTPPTTNPSTAAFELDNTFVHGTCTFHLQLFQQCVYKPFPTPSYQTSTIGFLFSIEDGSKKSVVWFPDGVGRFDGPDNARRLSGLGQGPDLFMVFAEGKAHFRYGVCLWDSGSGKGVAGQCGWCNVGGWTKGDLGCQGGMMDGAYRLSDMDCSFKC